MVGKFGQVFFGLVLFIKLGIFVGIQNNLRICDSSLVSRPRSCTNKVQPNLFCYCLNFQRITKQTHSIANVPIFHVMSFNAFWKFLWPRNLAWDFLAVKFRARDFLGF